MNDVFKEQLIKKMPTTKDTVLKTLIISVTSVLVFLIFLILGATQLSMLAPVLSAALCYLAYFLIGNFNIEYEYIFTNGELDIDVIYAKSRRKRLLTVDMREIEVMAHIEDTEHNGDFNKAEIVNDYSTGRVTPNTYAFVINYKGKRTKFILEPNDVLLKAFSTTLGKRKLFINPKAEKGER